MWLPTAILCIYLGGMSSGQRADCGVTMAGGPQVGVACAFPFVFNGFIYREGKRIFQQTIDIIIT